MRFKVKLTFRASLVLFIGLSGCSHKPKPITLRWSTWGDAAGIGIRQKAVDVFQKAHPEIEVKCERIPYSEYTSKLLAQYSAGSAPDVIELNCDLLIPFASKDLLTDLKPYADKDSGLRLGDYFPEAIRHFTLKGKLLALPWDVVPIAVIYYNKKAFDEAGLPYPKDNWDYRQFLKTAEKLTKKDAQGKVVQYGFVDDWPMWDAWVYDFGGDLVDNPEHPTRCTLDSPQAIAGAKFRADLILKYGVMPGPAYMTAMGGVGNSDLFMNGIAAMYMCGIWQTPTFRLIQNFDWDVVELPKGPNGHRGFSMTAEAYAVLKTCPHPDLAYQLVTQLTGEEGQSYFAASGIALPSLKTLAKSKVFLDGQRPRSKGFLVSCVKDGHFEPFDPNAAEWGNLFGSAMDRVFNGTAEVEKTMRETTRAINAKFFGKAEH